MPALAYAPARNSFGTREASFSSEAPVAPAAQAQPTQLANQQGGTAGEKAVSVLGAPKGDVKWKAAAAVSGYGAFQSRGLTRLAFLAMLAYSVKQASA